MGKKEIKRSHNDPCYVWSRTAKEPQFERVCMFSWILLTERAYRIASISYFLIKLEALKHGKYPVLDLSVLHTKITNFENMFISLNISTLIFQ